MINITKPAEECNVIPTANHSVAAIVEGAFKPKSTSDRSGDKSNQVHSFSKTLAAEFQAKKLREAQAKNKSGLRIKPPGHCANHAILIKYLAHRAKATGKRPDGKRGFYITVRELASKFPYLEKSAIWEIVKWLERNGYIYISNQNTATYDRTFWYNVPQKYRDKAEENLLYFHADVAKDIGVPAAVLVDNFNYWIGECEEGGTAKRVIMSPTTLATILPFGADTIERSLKTLVSTGKAKKLSKTRPIYGNIDLAIPAEPDTITAKADKIPAETDRISAEPDNNTLCKHVNNSLETHSKEKPSVFDFEILEGVTKQNNESDYSMEDDTEAAEQQRENISAISPFDTSIIPPPISKAQSIYWPTSLTNLHFINEDLVQSFEEIQILEKHSGNSSMTILRLCEQTLKSVPMSIVDSIYADPDGNEILSVLLPYFQTVMNKTRLDQAGKTYHILFHSALECLAGAFLWPRDNKDSYSHPIAPLVSITYRVYLHLWKREEDLRQKDIDEEFAQRRQAFASVDEHNESDPNLAPAEKMRFFRNALTARNKVGWIFFDQKHRTDKIRFDKGSLQLVEKLFTHNPHLCVLDLLAIHDKCMAAFIAQPPPEKPSGSGWYPPKGENWHVRSGYNIRIFMTNLHHIVNQLGECRVRVFLKDVKKSSVTDYDLAA